jgi:hypothetical protein
MFFKYNPGGSGGSWANPIKLYRQKFYISGPLGTPETFQKLLKIVVHYCQRDLCIVQCQFFAVKISIL